MNHLKRWYIRFVSGRTESVDGYRIRVDNGLLKIRTTHDTAYDEQWKSFPLANIESWEEM